MGPRSGMIWGEGFCLSISTWSIWGWVIPWPFGGKKGPREPREYILIAVSIDAAFFIWNTPGDPNHQEIPYPEHIVQDIQGTCIMLLLEKHYVVSKYPIVQINGVDFWRKTATLHYWVVEFWSYNQILLFQAYKSSWLVKCRKSYGPCKQPILYTQHHNNSAAVCCTTLTVLLYYII